ncbi:hypothetical protein RTP6_003562 [Batrachochytrium dendrobatidis]
MSAAIEAAVLTPASDTQSITHSTCTRPSLSTHTLGSEMAFLNPSRKQPTQPTKLPPQFEDFFKCFICFESLQKPVMCPGCSKVGCESCVKKWLQEEKSQCPHCRAPLNPSQLVHCRFMDDLAQQLNLLAFASPNSTQDVCPDHSAPMYYYCHDCQEGLCADCAVIETKHKNHSFEHLHAVYRRHRAKIDERAKLLYSRFNQYGELLAYLDDHALAISHARQTALAVHQTLWEEDVESIVKQETFHMSLLSECKQKVVMQADQLRVTLETLESQMAGAWQTDIISNSADIIHLVDQLNPSPISEFNIPPESMEFDSSTIPAYDHGVFLITNFKSKMQFSSPIYSDTISVSGLEWRLKVYCSGNGVCRNESLSVFVELVKGVAQPSKYQYRVDLINQSRGVIKKRNISREFKSEFSVGECWGYNRFYNLDLIEQEGFYDSDSDSIKLVFYVRAPTYAQKCRDLEFYISNLKLHHDNTPRINESTTVKANVSNTTELNPDQTTSDAMLPECDITEMGEHSHGLERAVTVQMPVYTSVAYAPSAEPPTDANTQMPLTGVETSLSHHPTLHENTANCNFPTTRPLNYHSSLQQLRSEMTEFEDFLGTVTNEIELFDTIVKSTPKELKLDWTDESIESEVGQQVTLPPPAASRSFITSGSHSDAGSPYLFSNTNQAKYNSYVESSTKSRTVPRSSTSSHSATRPNCPSTQSITYDIPSLDSTLLRLNANDSTSNTSPLNEMRKIDSRDGLNLVQYAALRDLIMTRSSALLNESDAILSRFPGLCSLNTTGDDSYLQDSSWINPRREHNDMGHQDVSSIIWAANGSLDESGIDGAIDSLEDDASISPASQVDQSEDSEDSEDQYRDVHSDTYDDMTELEDETQVYNSDAEHRHGAELYSLDFSEILNETTLSPYSLDRRGYSYPTLAGNED